VILPEVSALPPMCCRSVALDDRLRPGGGGHPNAPQTTAGRILSIEMDDIERIQAFLLNSGLVGQSLDAMRPDLPRWVDYLHERGVGHIPTAPWRAGPGDALAVNLLNQFALQASPRKDAMARVMKHNLRNLSKTRPYKP
jgi:hypothetical protein